MKTHPFCCDGASGPLTRRDFLKLGAAAGGAMTAAGAGLPAWAESAKKAPAAETLVTTLYKSLSEAQHQAIVFPFDDPLRSKVDNNWHITKQHLGDFFTKDQQQMIKEIFLGMHSEEYAQTVYDQVVHDSGEAGFEDSSVAIFGEPDSGKFEFVLTGRHCTRRCDGDSVEGAAFGGPIFYGHAAESFDETKDHPGNAYWFQALRANELYQMLDGKQREAALIDARGRPERQNETVALTGKKEGLAGLAVREMAADQQEHMKKVLRDLLAPFRQADAEEAMRHIEANGFDNLHLSFYKKQDIGEDGVWDVWQVEGPSMIWYFRGDPHVHVWANVRENPRWQS